ncbi:MAG: hypothetical protein WCG80_18460, partial [Spirochaetales bacterium]
MVGQPILNKSPSTQAMPKRTEVQEVLLLEKQRGEYLSRADGDEGGLACAFSYKVNGKRGACPSLHKKG